jgi:lysophospholipase L1-like esterase
MGRNDVRVWLRNLAEQGQTSGRLLQDQLSQVASLEPDVVTLQVGVNDIIAREVDSYRENVGAAFDELLGILPPERIFAITTPDHTLTEWGDAYGARKVGQAAVAELNDALAAEADSRGISVIDISAVNALVVGDPSLVIETGPYPSAKQYAGWAEVIGPHIRDALATAGP